MPFRLRTLPFSARLGATGLVAAMALGLVASALHLVNHYEKRDGVPGLTLDDIRAAYRGIEAPAPLRAALERGHPEALSPTERAALLAWIDSGRIAEGYDALEQGDEAPAEIMARACLSCHSRQAAPASDQMAAKNLPLDYFDDVKRIAYARSLPATPREIVLMSMHAHAPTMAMLSVVIGGLALLSAFPRRLIGWLIAVSGLALIADLSSWLLARELAGAVYVIVSAGFAYNAATGLLLLLVLAELWSPRLGAGRNAVRA